MSRSCRERASSPFLPLTPFVSLFTQGAFVPSAIATSVLRTAFPPSGVRVTRLLERPELHREAGDRLRRARRHLPLVLPHALVLVEEREDADEARTGQNQDPALF